MARVKRCHQRDLVLIINIQSLLKDVKNQRVNVILLSFCDRNSHHHNDGKLPRHKEGFVRTTGLEEADRIQMDHDCASTRAYWCGCG